MVLITVNNAKCVVRETTFPITSGMVGVPCKFVFGSEWNGLIKNAVFRGSGTEKVILNIGTECTIPFECLESVGTRVEVGVEGRNSEGTVVIPSVFAYVGTTVEGVSDDGEEAGTPTPSQVTQLQNAITGVSALAQQNSIDIADNLTAITALNSAKHVHNNYSILASISPASINAWNLATQNSHTHSNKSVIDGITETTVNSITANTNARHSHSNKSVIDGITSEDVARWNSGGSGGSLNYKYYDYNLENRVHTTGTFSMFDDDWEFINSETAEAMFESKIPTVKITTDNPLYESEQIFHIVYSTNPEGDHYGEGFEWNVDWDELIFEDGFDLSYYCPETNTYIYFYTDEGSVYIDLDDGDLFDSENGITFYKMPVEHEEELTEFLQPNYNQTDSSKPDYIVGKPDFEPNDFMKFMKFKGLVTKPINSDEVEFSFGNATHVLFTGFVANSSGNSELTIVINESSGLATTISYQNIPHNNVVIDISVNGDYGYTIIVNGKINFVPFDAIDSPTINRMSRITGINISGFPTDNKAFINCCSNDY